MVLEDELQQAAQQSILHCWVLAGEPGHIKLGQHPCSKACSDHRHCRGRHAREPSQLGFVVRPWSSACSGQPITVQALLAALGLTHA